MMSMVRNTRWSRRIVRPRSTPTIEQISFVKSTLRGKYERIRLFSSRTEGATKDTLKTRFGRRESRFDRYVDRRKDDSLKWTKYGEGTLPMWVADMDFRCPEPIVRSVTRRARSGLYGYAKPSKDLENLAVRRLENVYGAKGPRRTWIRWLPGLVPGLNHCVKAVVPHGAGVASFTPIYPPFLQTPEIQERTLHTISMTATTMGRKDNVMRYEMDMDRAHDVLSRDDVRCLLFCSPHNPTGRVWSESELIAIAEACVEHDVTICSDEVWGEMPLDPARRPFVSMLSLCDDVPGLKERLVVLTSPSKVFNVAGLDMAYAVVPDNDLRIRFIRAGRDKSEIPHFGFDACETAYGDDKVEEWRRDLVRYLLENRDFACDFLDTRLPEVRFTVPEASYLLWMDVGELNRRDEEEENDNVASASRWIASEYRLGLSDGIDFGANGDFVRMNFACPRLTLRRGLERLEAALRRSTDHAFVLEDDDDADRAS